MSLEDGLSSRRNFIKGLTGLALAASTGALFGEERKIGREVTWIMSPEAVAEYVDEEIGPRINRMANNPILGIRDRIREIIINTQPDGPMLYSGVGGYHAFTPNSVTHLDYSSEAKKPVFFVYVPAMQKMISGLTEAHYKPEEIDLIVGIIYAHEQIHYENSEVTKKYPPLASRVEKVDEALRTKEEAETWGITVLEMIRPALEKGFRLPERFVEYSKTLKNVGDDYHSTEWISIFKTY